MDAPGQTLMLRTFPATTEKRKKRRAMETQKCRRHVQEKPNKDKQRRHEQTTYTEETRGRGRRARILFPQILAAACKPLLRHYCVTQTARILLRRCVATTFTVAGTAACQLKADASRKKSLRESRGHSGKPSCVNKRAVGEWADELAQLSTATCSH